MSECDTQRGNLREDLDQLHAIVTGGKHPERGLAFQVAAIRRDLALLKWIGGIIAGALIVNTLRPFALRSEPADPVRIEVVGARPVSPP